MHTLLKRTMFLVLGSAMLPVLSGCWHDQMHQPIYPVAPPVVFNTQDALYRNATPEKRKEDRNHATVEFLEDGSFADPACKQNQRCQLDDAKDFIHAARLKAIAAHKHLTVILFIHGNENNATDYTDNYPHFRQALNCLNLGQAAYVAAYKQYFRNMKTVKHVLPCDGFQRSDTERYVGIFIGWRGRHTRSVFNLRQRVAFQISQGPDIVPTFYQLRDAAKQAVPNEGDPARFIAFGHSFGGLLLEQVAIRIYKEAYARTDSTAAGPCANGVPEEGLLPFTDGMVTINAAINSVPAERFIMFLRSKTFCDVDPVHDPGVAPSMYSPYLASLVSKNDFWSNLIGSSLRHKFGYERNPLMGRPLPLPPNPSVFKDEPSSTDIFASTPSHTTYLQNLCYLTNDLPGDDICENEMLENPARDILVPPVRGLALTNGAPASPTQNLFVRYACRTPDNIRTGKHPQNYAPLPPLCSSLEPTQHRADLLIWNTTPFWVGALNKEVIRNHDDFWNIRFMSILGAITFSHTTRTPSELIRTPTSVVPRVDWTSNWPLL